MLDFFVKVLLFQSLMDLISSQSQVIKVPNLALYKVIPTSKEHMLFINRIRTEDAGVWFIHGIGVVGEPMDVVFSEEFLKYGLKEFQDLNLFLEPQFASLTLEMSNEEEEEAKGKPPQNSHRHKRFKRRKLKKSAKPSGRSMDLMDEAAGQEMIAEGEAEPLLVANPDDMENSQSDEEDSQEKEEEKETGKDTGVEAKKKEEPISPPPAPIPTVVTQLSEVELISSPDIFSGVFLELSSSSADHKHLDKLSFGVKVNSSNGNPFLCLSTTKTEDVPIDWSKEWMFEKTEEKGYFTLRNKKILNGIVSWDDEDEQYLVIETRKEPLHQFRKNGHYRSNALFKVTRSKESNRSYEFAILGRDRSNIHIAIDPSWMATTGCFLLRRTTKEKTLDDDQMEYLFKMQKPLGSLKIYATVEHVKYKQSLGELYQRALAAGTTIEMAKKSVSNHADQAMHIEIKDEHKRRDIFQITFKFPNNNSILSLDDVFIQAGLGIPNEEDGEEEEGGMAEEISFIKLETEPGQETTQQFSYKVSGALNVPPWTSMEYTIVFGWLEKLKMGFEGQLKIMARTDRITKSDSPRLLSDQTVDFDYFRISLRRRRFSLTGLKVLKLEKESVTIFIEGGIVAKTLGIKGEIETTTTELSRDVFTACKMENNHSE